MPSKKNNYKSLRQLHQVDELTTTPPAEFPPTHLIARLTKAQGQNVFLCTLPNNESILAELGSTFRNMAWMKRGMYVVINTDAFEQRGNKLGGEIQNIVRNEAAWKKMDYWPEEFKRSQFVDEEDDEQNEDSVVGKMPPNSDDEE